jgi:phage FluMu protein Com
MTAWEQSRKDWDHTWTDLGGNDDLRNSNWRNIRCSECGKLRAQTGVATEYREWCSVKIEREIQAAIDETVEQVAKMAEEDHKYALAHDIRALKSKEPHA